MRKGQFFLCLGLLCALIGITLFIEAKSNEKEDEQIWSGLHPSKEMKAEMQSMTYSEEPFVYRQGEMEPTITNVEDIMVEKLKVFLPSFEKAVEENGYEVSENYVAIKYIGETEMYSLVYGFKGNTQSDIVEITIQDSEKVALYILEGCQIDSLGFGDTPKATLIENGKTLKITPN